MTSMFEALRLCEVMSQPELAARLDRQGEVLAGWLVTVGLLLVLAVF